MAALLAGIGGMPELAIAIVIVIICNGSFAFAQEYRATAPPTGSRISCRPGSV